jgi:RNA polymerase primary sigma factor
MGSARGTGRELEGLSFYLAAVQKYPPLTREAEHMLALRAGEGDASAGQKLVRHNLALVVYVARRQSRGTARLDDLIQEGNFGLMRAAEKFDPQVGTRFSTYAVWWIRAFIRKYLNEGRSTVRPQAGTAAQPDVSLDAAVGENGDATYLDLIADDGAGPEGRYSSAESDRAVRDALAQVRERISKRGWDILNDRLQQDSPKSLAEIAKRWSVSRERVRQVEVRVKRFLEQHLRLAIPEAAGCTRGRGAG